MADRALVEDESLAEAKALRAHARAMRVQCRGALADMAELPDAAFQNNPELTADKFVCLVERARFDEAAALETKIPATAATRPDVERARALLARKGARAATSRLGNRKEEGR